MHFASIFASSGWKSEMEQLDLETLVIQVVDDHEQALVVLEIMLSHGHLETLNLEGCHLRDLTLIPPNLVHLHSRENPIGPAPCSVVVELNRANIGDPLMYKLRYIEVDDEFAQ
ncbi:hypothetical protein Y032_0160g3348 [Ancylostoma ceylanicum]|uniref:Uncharacterized protein n=1 Tax=Ancylostoma ceylanicum TaxID=53326 RepID=A0A016SYL7_9BILA|nr:hypothetical protein Y032_0160g3348 [Ancylostoma ceylanicum]